MTPELRALVAGFDERLALFARHHAAIGETLAHVRVVLMMYRC